MRIVRHDQDAKKLFDEQQRVVKRAQQEVTRQELVNQSYKKLMEKKDDLIGDAGSREFILNKHHLKNMKS